MRPQDLLPDSSSSIQLVMRRLGACLQGALLFVCHRVLWASRSLTPPASGLIVAAICLTLIVRLFPECTVVC